MGYKFEFGLTHKGLYNELASWIQTFRKKSGITINDSINVSFYLNQQGLQVTCLVVKDDKVIGTCSDFADLSAAWKLIEENNEGFPVDKFMILVRGLEYIANKIQVNKIKLTTSGQHEVIWEA